MYPRSPLLLNQTAHVWQTNQAYDQEKELLFPTEPALFHQI